MRDHVRCPDCEGCLACGIHTAGVTCNGTSSTPQLIIRTDELLADDEVSEFRERLKEALGSENFNRLGVRILLPGGRHDGAVTDWEEVASDDLCTPGCPDDACRSEGTCAWPGRT